MVCFNRFMKVFITRILFTLLFFSIGLVNSVSSQNAQPKIYYTAMGDSIAAGYSNDGQSYVGFFLNNTEVDTGFDVELINKTRNGWESENLLNGLGTQSFQTSIQNSNIVTWQIGGNDFIQARFRYLDGGCGGSDNQDCLRSVVSEVQNNWEAIFEEILSLRQTNRHMLRVIDLYNPFINADRNSDSWSTNEDCEKVLCNDYEIFKPYFDQINLQLENLANEHDVPLVKVSITFNGPNGDEDPGDKGYITFDGIHPNDRGHEVIAQLISDSGYSPIWPPAQSDGSDSDGDGVPDEDDLCPNFAGSPQTDGC